jgi:hypothetical protein
MPYLWIRVEQTRNDASDDCDGLVGDAVMPSCNCQMN